MERERFRRLLRHLAEEVDRGVGAVRIDAYRARPEDRWAGYDPDAVDFVRRCETEAQAEEIIDFLERRREITAERAGELRRQLRAGGLGSFGKRKRPGHYLREL